MKREIKFKAWDIKNNCFSEELFFRLLLTNNNQVYNSEKDEYSEIGEKYHICWFTSLKDNNNQNIYVGDILSEKWKVEVYQNDEGTFMVKFYNSKHGKDMSLKQYLIGREKAGCKERDCIIIGNIYKNPELINLT